MGEIPPISTKNISGTTKPILIMQTPLDLKDFKVLLFKNSLQIVFICVQFCEKKLKITRLTFLPILFFKLALLMGGNNPQANLDF